MTQGVGVVVVVVVVVVLNSIQDLSRILSNL